MIILSIENTIVDTASDSHSVLLLVYFLLLNTIVNNF